MRGMTFANRPSVGSVTLLDGRDRMTDSGRPACILPGDASSLPSDYRLRRPNLHRFGATASMPAACVSNLQQPTIAARLCDLPYINSHAHLLC